MPEFSVRDLMTTSVITVTPDTPLVDACRLMLEHQISSIIVAEHQRATGILTERDLARLLIDALERRLPATARVSEYMSSSVTSVTELTSVVEAVAITQSQGIRHLPVANADGALAGIVTQSDLVRAHMQMVENHHSELTSASHSSSDQQKAVLRKLDEIALEDRLLRIGNRRRLEVDLEFTHKIASSKENPYTLVVLDMDYLHGYNDRLGKRRGDDLLRTCCQTLQLRLGEKSALYRYEDDEFVAILPGKQTDDGVKIATAMVEGISLMGITHPSSHHGRVTASAGVASFNPKSKLNHSRVLQQAFTALAQAKEQGRNRCVEATA